MSNYHYKAIDDSGRVVKGHVAAFNEADVEQELKRRGLFLIESTARSESLGSKWLSRRRIRSKMLIEFYHRFAQTLEIGLPILSSLEEIGRSLPCRVLKGVVGEVQFAVEAGSSLQEAMHRYPWAFQPLDLAMISMGEKSGVLPKCLRDLATYHEWKAEIRAVFKKALLYPAFIGCAIAAVIGVWIGYVLPQMVKVLSELGVALPWVTTLLLDASTFLKAEWMWLASGMLLGGGAFYLYQRTDSGRLAVHRRLLALPVIGGIVRNMALTRLCHNFATMLAAGMTINSIFQTLSRRAMGNRYLEERLAAAHQEIERGESIAGGLEKAGGFPSLLLGAIRNGETTGTIDASFKRMGEHYDREVKRTMQVLVNGIEPVAIFALGGVFGIIVLSIMLPLYDVMGDLGKAY
jgi:type II secretory pathway component PulF